jgi:hypothetical protein
MRWRLTASRSLNASCTVKFVNTSMHGVSDPFVVNAFKAYGFAPFIPVKEQQSPDPEFPTVKVSSLVGWIAFSLLIFMDTMSFPTQRRKVCLLPFNNETYVGLTSSPTGALVSLAEL